MLFELLPIAESQSSGTPSPFFVHVIVSAIIFIVLWQILARVFFKPVFKVLEEREARTIGDEIKAHELKNEARDLTHYIESQLRVARAEGIKRRDDIIAKSKREANKILEQGQIQTSSRLKAAQSEIHQLKESAKKELALEAEKLADEAFRRILT